MAWGKRALSSGLAYKLAIDVPFVTISASRSSCQVVFAIATAGTLTIFAHAER